MTVIGPHAGRADTTKRQVLLHDVHDDVIQAHPAGRCAIQHIALFVGIAAKVIQRQWPGLAVNVANSLAEVLIGFNG